MEVPKKTFRVRGKPRIPQSRPPITRGKTRLNSDEPKEFPPVGAVAGASIISTSEAPRAGERIEAFESILNTAAAEDGSWSGLEDGEKKEDDSGNADEDADY